MSGALLFSGKKDSNTRNHAFLGESVMVEVTQIGKECHNRCAIYYQAGDCIMPREGIFARVLRGGKIRRGDSIRITDENSPDEGEK